MGAVMENEKKSLLLLVIFLITSIIVNILAYILTTQKTNKPLYTDFYKLSFDVPRGWQIVEERASQIILARDDEKDPIILISVSCDTDSYVNTFLDNYNNRKANSYTDDTYKITDIWTFEHFDKVFYGYSVIYNQITKENEPYLYNTLPEERKSSAHVSYTLVTSEGMVASVRISHRGNLEINIQAQKIVESINFERGVCLKKLNADDFLMEQKNKFWTEDN